MVAKTLERVTEEQYLAAENAAQTKHEYLNGHVWAMSGASHAHLLICTNLLASFHAALGSSACETYGSDCRVRIGAYGSYVYPDLSIACGNPLFEGTGVPSLTNPILILEVLSPSTEAFDRGAKFAHYRGLPTIEDYVLVSSTSAAVEVYSRKPDGWTLRETTGLSGVVAFESVGVQLSMASIYARVVFESDTTVPLPPDAS